MRAKLSIFFRVVLVALFVLGTVAEDTASDKGSPIGFQAEVSKMLDILINSLYTNRAVFLRELISNGSDALDKIRVMYLTAPKEAINKDGEVPTMDLRISLRPELRQVIIRDGGVGMTRQELADHLGSLGTSGTKRFLESLQQAQSNAVENHLIGQFGVGFYSAFLVAERVSVASKSDADPVQHIWESAGDGAYYLYEDPRGNTLGRGTEITLTIKPDAQEFLQSETLKKFIHQYSEFIHFPIYVAEAVEPTSTAAPEEAEPAETPAEEASRWVLVNENKPIWTRPPQEVSEAEYNQFYKSTTKDYKEPMYYSHFSVEGEVEFRSLLYVPTQADVSLFAEDSQVTNNIKLYVRRVFITDEFRDLLPRYLNFVKGVVDSDDLPLNVSRELLQENRILRIIKKKLVRKALGMFADMAEQSERLQAKDAGAAAGDHGRPGTKALTTPVYDQFWKSFGQHLRVGLIQDTSNRGRLTKLLRYKSSKSEDAYISFQTYIERMREGQKGIYYLSGDSVEHIKRSPLLEDATRRGVEVVYMVDAIDEYVVAQVPDVAGTRLINLAKEGVVFDDEENQQRAVDERRSEHYQDFFQRLRTLFGASEVRKVVLTKRQTSAAFIISSAEDQPTARLANMIRQQALAWDGHKINAARVVEVNYRHPLVAELVKRLTADETDAVAKDIAWVLYDTANLQAEFPVSDVAAYARRVDRLLRSSADLPVDASLLPPDDERYLAEIKEDEEGEGEAEPESADEPAVGDHEADL